jgi:hypothetical protein
MTGSKPTHNSAWRLESNSGESSNLVNLLLAALWDIENIFDELKNQWGWGGFTTHDMARCRLAARLVALFYNWWNIFVRLAEPDRHMEAITSRPLLLHAIAARVRYARQTALKMPVNTPRRSQLPKRFTRSSCSCVTLQRTRSS